MHIPIKIDKSQIKPLKLIRNYLENNVRITVMNEAPIQNKGNKFMQICSSLVKKTGKIY